ncbi:tetratricopeptide (TPR) repeat protein [Pullulanibacillus pueri]|nr:tetratricopeptide (TPR) repeat protein [Pullulanibacillus pueri]
MVRDHTPKKRYGWWWLMPLFIFLLIAGTLTGCMLYEQSKTAAAIASFQKGETLAKKGDYQEAYQAFEQATKKRRNFAEANLDKTVVTLGLSIQKDFDQVDAFNKKKDYAKALTTLDESEQKLKGYKGDIVNNLKEAISNKRVNTMVQKLRLEMKSKKTIDELSSILEQAKALDVPEAHQIADEILKQIVELAYTKASNLLQQNQFSEALQAVTDGLNYDKNNKKLLDLQDTIKNAQDSFESAQEERIQQAMAAAEKERQHNKNDAVQLVSAKAKLNEYGDLVVSGKVKSDATVPITMIKVAYTLTDQDGKKFKSNEVYATPDTVNPGEEAQFEYTHMAVNKDLKLKVTGFTWYVDN